MGRTTLICATALLLAALNAAPGLAAGSTASLKVVAADTTTAATADPVEVTTDGDPSAAVATGDGAAASVGIATGDDLSLDATVGCAAATAETGDAGADAVLGSCPSGESPAASVAAASGDSAATADVGCIAVDGSSGGIDAGASAGSCPASSTDAAGVTGSGDAAVMSLVVGCVEAGVEGAAAASAGSCAEQEAAGGGAGPDAGIGAGDVGASGAGAPSGSRGSGAAAGFVGGNLPFTGLPVWLVALLGLALAGAGVWVRRARGLGAA